MKTTGSATPNWCREIAQEPDYAAALAALK
jgi:hypothetical protein